MAGPSGSASKRFTLRTNEAQTEPQWQVDDFSAIVDPGGNGHYTTLAAAVTGEPVNARIYLKNGTHAVAAAITLKAGQEIIGESRTGTIIDFGAVAGNRIITALNTRISNLTITNGSITALAQGVISMIAAARIEDVNFTSCIINSTGTLTNTSAVILDTSSTGGMISNVSFATCQVNGTGTTALISSTGTFGPTIRDVTVTGISSTGSGVVIHNYADKTKIYNVKSVNFVSATGQLGRQFIADFGIDLHLSGWTATNPATETVAGPTIYAFAAAPHVDNIVSTNVTPLNARPLPLVTFGGNLLSDSIFNTSGAAPVANTTTEIVRINSSFARVSNVRVSGQRATTFGRCIGINVLAAIDDAMITNCQAINCNIGIQVAAATCDRTLVAGNAIRNAVTPISNLGTGSVLSGNQTV